MNRFEAKAEGKKLELKIYGEIDEYSESNDSVNNVKELNTILKDNADVNMIDIYINSAGGSVFEGIAIYNILKRNKAYKRVFIEGFACSIASVIAMCGNQVIMPESSIMMIHNAWCCTIGNSKELRKTAEDLDVINDNIRKSYMSRFKGTEEELQSIMDAEKYLTAEECLEKGLCTKIIEDTEENQKETEDALDKHIAIFNNKFKQLESIRNAIKSLNEDSDVEEEKSEEVNEVVATAEISNEDDSSEETSKSEDKEDIGAMQEAQEVEIADAENSVKESKNNALQRFFNMSSKDKQEDMKNE